MDETKVISLLVQQSERLNTIEETMSTLPTKTELFGKLDGMSQILYRLDQERVFTAEWIHRIEQDVERIKKQLQIA